MTWVDKVGCRLVGSYINLDYKIAEGYWKDTIGGNGRKNKLQGYDTRKGLI